MENNVTNFEPDDDEQTIQISNNLQDLDQSYNNYLVRTYDDRKKADQRCIEKYGCTNTELYTRVRAQLLKNQKITNSKSVSNIPVTEVGFNFTNQYSDYTHQSMISKIDKANMIMDSDPNIVIINDFDTDEPDYTEEDLYDMYQKYEMLPQKQKNFSNGYSVSIWGKTVPDMFRYIMGKFTRVDADEMTSDLDKILFGQKEAISSPKFTNDIVKHEMAKIDFNIKSPNRTLAESVYLEDLISKVEPVHQDFMITQSIVPILTPDEYEDLNGTKIEDPYDYIDIHDQKKYLHLIDGLQNQFKQNPEIESTIIKLGWNPYIKIDHRSIKFAKEKQQRWFEQHMPKVHNINLTSFKTNIAEEDLMYDEQMIQAVYFLNTHQDHIIDWSGYCFGSLKKVYEFGTNTPIDFFEQLRNYGYDDGAPYLDIRCIYVNQNIYQEIIFAMNGNEPGQGSNPNPFKGKELEVAISQEIATFARHIDTLSEEEDSNSGNLYYMLTNAYIYDLYDGKKIDYIPGTASKKAKALVYCTKKPMEQVQEEDIVDTIYSGLIENLFITSYNDKANKLLSELRSIVYPKTCIAINEIRAPFGLDDKGLYINFPKDLQKEYEEAHRLLKMYSSNNLDGIKHELAHLYYINWVIEKKLKHTKKGTDKYKELIDLRARVLNDFKKYFKFVCEKDPNFDFMAYLKSTEYYTKYMEIDYSTLANIGKIISQYSNV